MQLDFDDLLGARPPSPKTYGVSELVHLASRKLEANFGDVWVEGEISNLRLPTSGHFYFTLKDAQAQLPVVMFRSAATRLRFRLEDGLALRCRGRLSIYEAQGRFQLTAETAEPAGCGALQLAFEQLKRQLESEGLFAPERKVPLPRLPRTVAVVTSPTGAALWDIVRVLHSRCPVRIVVSPTAVQGSEAAPEIVEALARADQLGADLIILARGGGSLEDLWAFNTEAVARAIFATRTPLISAIGHEVDTTIADLVADCRAPTPSAAAEIAVPVMADLIDHVQQARARLGRAMCRRLGEGALVLERLRRRLRAPLRQINRSRLLLDESHARAVAACARRCGLRRAALLQLKARLVTQEPRVRLQRRRASLRELQQGLLALTRARFMISRQALALATSQLQALNPLAVLERGYGLVLDSEGQVIRELDRLQHGDTVVVRLAKGELLCTVESVRRKA